MKTLMTKQKEEQGNNQSNMLTRVRNDVERMFDRFAHDPWNFPMMVRTGVDWIPAIDMVNGEKEVTIRAELPGVEPNHVDVSLTGNVLTISGEKEESFKDETKNYFVSERRYGAFRRAIQLPDGINPEMVSAHHDNGVLTVTIARLKEATPKHIRVKSMGMQPKN